MMLSNLWLWFSFYSYFCSKANLLQWKKTGKSNLRLSVTIENLLQPSSCIEESHLFSANLFKQMCTGLCDILNENFTWFQITLLASLIYDSFSLLGPWRSVCTHTHTLKMYLFTLLFVDFIFFLIWCSFLFKLWDLI